MSVPSVQSSNFLSQFPCSVTTGVSDSLWPNRLQQARPSLSITISWSLPFNTLRKRKSEITQPCPTLCDPMDCRSPGSSVHGISQARRLEWVAISFSSRFSQPRDRTPVSRIAGRRFNLSAKSPYPSIIFPYTIYQLLTSHTFICLFIFFFHLNTNSVNSKDFSYKSFSYSQDNAAQICTWPSPGSSNIFYKKVLMHIKNYNNFPGLHSHEFLLRWEIIFISSVLFNP